VQDDRGNLIDGTSRARERARPWLGARPKPQSEEETAGSRSEAPKNLAASLLVPADMVDTTAAPATPENLIGDPGGLGRGVPPQRTLDEDANGRGTAENLFLAPDAAVATDADWTRSPGHRRIAGLLGRMTAAAADAIRRMRPRREARTGGARRWPQAVRVRRAPAAALGAIVAIAAAAAVVALTEAGSSAPSRSAAAHTGSGSLERLGSAALLTSKAVNALAARNWGNHRHSSRARSTSARPASNNSGAVKAAASPTSGTSSSDTSSSAPASATPIPSTSSSNTGSSAPASSVQSSSPPPSYSSAQQSAPAPQPSRVSPSGALTCISNCG
jgi:hypothetical protein